MTLDALYESKKYVKNEITFPHIATYVDPFLNIIGDSELTIEAVEGAKNANEDDEMNVSYGRVKVEAKINQDIEDMESIVGLILGFDVKPVIKVYTGQNVSACTNLCIFNAEQIFSQDLTQQHQRIYDQTQRYLDAKEKENAEYVQIISELKNTFLTHKQLDERLGFMLRQVREPQFKRLGVNTITHAAELIDDRESMYYVPATDECSLWRLYNALTQGITRSKEFLDKPMKTLVATNLLKHVRCN